MKLWVLIRTHSRARTHRQRHPVPSATPPRDYIHTRTTPHEICTSEYHTSAAAIMRASFFLSAIVCVMMSVRVRARVCICGWERAVLRSMRARTPTTGPSSTALPRTVTVRIRTRVRVHTTPTSSPFSTRTHRQRIQLHTNPHTHTHARHLLRVAHRGPKNRTTGPPPKYVAGGTLHAAEQFTQKHRSGVVCVCVCGDTTSAARAERAPPSSSTRYSRNGRLASKQPNIVFVCVVFFWCCWFV